MTQPVFDRRARIAGEIRAELARQGKSRAALVRFMRSEGHQISPATLSRRLKGNKPFWFEEVATIAQFLELPLSEFTARTDVAAA